jgi:hypothetical protein
MANLEELLSIAFLVPMDDDPSDASCKWGLPLMLCGTPGIGKSDRVRQAARSVGLETKVVLPATRQPEDFSGVPMPDGKGGITIECIMPAIRYIANQREGVLFIDEISCARPAVQSALLGFIQDRIVGDLELPGGVRVIGAGNRAEDAAGGWNLAPPLANRLAWFHVEPPTAREWGEWLISGPRKLRSLVAGEAMVRAAWPTVWAKTRGLGAAFMAANDALLYQFPDEGNPDRHEAWASHRMWTNALRAIATCHALGQSNLQFDFVKACVGEAGATEWAAWIVDRDLPDPKEMLTKGWQPNRDRVDVTIAALQSMATYLKGYPSGSERDGFAVKAWEILGAASNLGMADAIVVPSKVLLDAGYTASGGSAAVRAAATPVIKKAGDLGLRSTAR